jgi:hypothetical protein
MTRPEKFSTTNIDLATALTDKGKESTIVFHPGSNLASFEFAQDADLYRLVAEFSSGSAEARLLNIRNQLFRRVRGGR